MFHFFSVFSKSLCDVGYTNKVRHFSCLFWHFLACSVVNTALLRTFGESRRKSGRLYEPRSFAFVS